VDVFSVGVIEDLLKPYNVQEFYKLRVSEGGLKISGLFSN
jgi:hypothetical protein